MPPDEQGSLWISSDQTPVFYRCYPGYKSDYYFSIIHGYGEHSGRYARLIQCLQSTGRAVLVYDLRGHGRSGGERGGLAVWEQYWEDFRGLNEHVVINSKVPTRKKIILGHSLGGLIALDGALRDEKDISGIILSSPCLGLPLLPGMKLLNSCIAHFFPHFSYSHPVKSEDLSRDENLCRAYDQDPTILKSIRAGTLREMIRAGDKLAKVPLSLHMPLWLLAAGNERVVDLMRTLSIYARLDAPFKKLKIFESFRQEIFNEVRNEIAYDTVLQAVEQIVAFNSSTS